MARLSLHSVGIEFPVFNASTRSLTNSIVSIATGGRINADESGYVKVKALSDLTLDAHAGDRIGIFGHNGSGKSTLLRLIAGIYEPTSGTIHRNGSVSSLIDIGIGISPENTGRENVYLRGRLLGLSSRELSSKFDEIVDFADLGKFIDLPVRTYSSGMLLRLAFAVSTSTNADIVVMDEWLSVGDEAFEKRAQQRLQDLVDNAEILFIASHDKSLLRNTTRKCLHLENGIAKNFGDTEVLVEKYFT